MIKFFEKIKIGDTIAKSIIRINFNNIHIIFFSYIETENYHYFQFFSIMIDKNQL